MTHLPLKSLAHPDWPYTGTPHEWRGFAEKGFAIKRMSADDFAELLTHLDDKAKRVTIYQKQNFGPELK
jgi:hypothetical protein